VASSVQLLRNMEQVLRREGVSFFLIYGSLIGAVRDGGALPYSPGLAADAYPCTASGSPLADVDVMVNVSQADFLRRWGPWWSREAGSLSRALFRCDHSVRLVRLRLPRPGLFALFSPVPNDGNMGDLIGNRLVVKAFVACPLRLDFRHFPPLGPAEILAIQVRFASF
jgi:hypothetical protein